MSKLTCWSQNIFFRVTTYVRAYIPSYGEQNSRDLVGWLFNSVDSSVYVQGVRLKRKKQLFSERRIQVLPSAKHPVVITGIVSPFTKKK